MNLREMQIDQGKINVQLKNELHIHLDGVDATINSVAMVKAKNIEAIEQSVDHIRFNNGRFIFNDLTLDLNDVHYDGDDRLLKLKKATIQNDENTVQVTAENAALKNLVFNELRKDIELDGVSWQKGIISVSGKKKNWPSNASAVSLHIKNVKGNDTKLLYNQDNRTLSTFIRSINADAIVIPGQGKFSASSLKAKGQKLELKNDNVLLKINNYEFNDAGISVLNDVHFSGNSTSVSITAFTPEIVFKGNSFLNDTILLDETMINRPEADIHITISNSSKLKDQRNFPNLQFKKLTILNPSIYAALHDSAGRVSYESLQLKDEQSVIELGDLKIGEPKMVLMKELSMKGTSLVYTDKSGRKSGVDKGYLDLKFGEISFQNTGKEIAWSMELGKSQLRNIIPFRLSKNNGLVYLKTAGIESLHINSNSIREVKSLLNANARLKVSGVNGCFQMTKTGMNGLTAILIRLRSY